MTVGASNTSSATVAVAFNTSNVGCGTYVASQHVQSNTSITPCGTTSAIDNGYPDGHPSDQFSFTLACSIPSSLAVVRSVVSGWGAVLYAVHLYTMDLCPPGSFCPLFTGTRIGCPAGTFSNVTGAITNASCVSCAGVPGWYCPVGSSNRVPCPLGTFCNGVDGSVATPCAAGRYSVVTGASICVVCAVGQYCPLRNSTGIACPKGTLCNVTGLAAPIDCLGTYCPSVTWLALPCPAGWFCPSRSTGPQICPIGFFCGAGATAPAVCNDAFRSSVAGMFSFFFLFFSLFLSAPS